MCTTSRTVLLAKRCHNPDSRLHSEIQELDARCHHALVHTLSFPRAHRCSPSPIMPPSDVLQTRNAESETDDKLIDSCRVLEVLLTVCHLLRRYRQQSSKSSYGVSNHRSRIAPYTENYMSSDSLLLSHISARSRLVKRVSRRVDGSPPRLRVSPASRAFWGVLVTTNRPPPRCIYKTRCMV